MKSIILFLLIIIFISTSCEIKTNNSETLKNNTKVLTESRDKENFRKNYWVLKNGNLSFIIKLDTFLSKEQRPLNQSYIQEVEILKDGNCIQKIFPPKFFLKSHLDSSDVIKLVDADFDGQKDIQLLNWLSVDLQRSYIYWFYDSTNTTFKRDSFLDDLWNPEFIALQKKVKSSERIDPNEQRFIIYEIRDNKLILIEEEVLVEDDEGKNYLLHSKKTINGLLYEGDAILKKTNSNTDYMESALKHKNDTLFRKFSWGERTIISLGTIEKNSIKYNIKTVFKKVKLANGYRGSSFILIEKNAYLTYCYDVIMPENLPSYIIKNRLYFQSKNCMNEVLEFNDELICFDCLNSECFLKEENVINE